MGKIKNIMTCCLASVLMCTSITATASATSTAVAENEKLGLDRFDAILASHYFLASPQNDMIFWSDALSDVDIVPLYDAEGEISSYYVELSDGSMTEYWV